jgi:hypothetical protein
VTRSYPEQLHRGSLLVAYELNPERR